MHTNLQILQFTYILVSLCSQVSFSLFQYLFFDLRIVWMRLENVSTYYDAFRVLFKLEVSVSELVTNGQVGFASERPGVVVILSSTFVILLLFCQITCK